MVSSVVWFVWFFHAEKPGAFLQEKTDTSYPRASLCSCLWQLLVTNGSHASNSARLGLRWCRSPTRLTKSHTGPHWGKFVFTSVFPQPFPAGSNRQLLQHENVVGQKKIFSPMAFSLVSLSHIFSVGFPPRFSKYVLRSLFFVLCGSIFAWRASPLLGKTKGRDCSGFRINIHFSATFWSKFIRMLAAWAREAVLFGAIRPNHHHHHHR